MPAFAGMTKVDKPTPSTTECAVNDYDALRHYLKKQTLPEFVLSFEQIEDIIDAALPRAAHRASWWETLRSPQEKMPQREACLAGTVLLPYLFMMLRVVIRKGS